MAEKVYRMVDDLVDTGIARAIRQMYPNAKFVTVFAKPGGCGISG